MTKKTADDYINPPGDNDNSLDSVKNYAYYIKASRRNYQPEGFHFDVNMFENLIDWWTPKNEIPVILRCSLSDLDRFCFVVYKMNYDEVYNFLSGITNAFMRKTFKNHANAGHAFSQSLVSKHFMGLSDDNNPNENLNITIVNDLKSDDDKED